jgi:hypothetical protein
MSDQYKPLFGDVRVDNPALDLTKFRVGDFVTVRTRILAFAGPTADALPIAIDPNPWASEIISHEPTIEGALDAA